MYTLAKAFLTVLLQPSKTKKSIKHIKTEMCSFIDYVDATKSDIFYTLRLL
jgi:hypothetical protein